MIPVPLEAQFIPARVAVKVTLHQPVAEGQVKAITGTLLGAMMARGELHHYRVAVGEGLIYLAPPSWVAECGEPAVLEGVA